MKGSGNRIRELRLLAGLSQEKLASQVQSSSKSIQRYESGQRPDSHTLINLATYFNVSTDYLLGLKSYKESIKERKEKVKSEEGYGELYRNYLNCINNYEIAEDKTYYWIELKDDSIGGQTKWIGWFDEERTLEIRRLRSVDPKKAIETCTRMNGKPMVLNSEIDAMVFLIYGGQAIVRADICEKYLPEFLQDYIEPSPDLKIFDESFWEDFFA